MAALSCVCYLWKELFFFFHVSIFLCFHSWDYPQLEPADPDFYKIGYVRSVRAYGVEFKEGPNGFGVYASKDVEPLRRARVNEFFSIQDYAIESFTDISLFLLPVDVSFCGILIQMVLDFSFVFVAWNQVHYYYDTNFWFCPWMYRWSWKFHWNWC